MGLSRQFTSNQQEAATLELILASQSGYKQRQLTELGLKFTSISPRIHEDHSLSDNPASLASELAVRKAADVLQRHPDSLIIGSDQTAQDPEGNLLTKPGQRDRAIEQLLRCRGRTVTFHSGVCVLSAGTRQSWSIPTTVAFRDLTRAEIERYVDRDQPFDCAGSFKVEALGISLFDHIHSDDPSALIGLPLISLCRELRAFGIDLP